jgi:hypothetical protein
MFFAYDTPDDYEPLVKAGQMLLDADFTVKSHTLRCYVLCGFPRDTFYDAELRMVQTLAAGFMPMAMLFRDSRGGRDPEWARWARTWIRPAIIHSRRGAPP